MAGINEKIWGYYVCEPECITGQGRGPGEDGRSVSAVIWKVILER